MTLGTGGTSWNPTAGIVPSLFPHAHLRESAPRLDALESILDEFGERWRRGEGPRAEDFISRLGRCDPADVVELIYHEFCLAESSDDPPDATLFLARFPQYRDRLARLFGLRDALGASRLDALAAPESAEWPEAGGEIGPYTLVRTLGQGTFARVFLAEQVDLERRLVVVKVANRPSPEPRLLARAQHAHIVDVLRHGETADGQLHLICMPFLGGATLADVLAERADRGGRSRSGRDFLHDLDRSSAPEYPEANLERPAREILARLSYPKAVAWVIARLAEALDHAHSRGVTHGDLKPSNVLMTSDGRPMLFDFNLAVDWGDADARDDGGGTLAYMAPERLAALAGTKLGRSPRPSERHRADIYALGLVLLETLTGTRPDLPDADGLLPRELAARMADARADAGFIRPEILRRVPSGLRAILERCLAVVPDDRYARASELAEDLDRYRCDLPPIHVEESFFLPHALRWARRQRLALTAGLLIAVAGAVAAALASSTYRVTLHEQAVAKLNSLWNGHEPGVYRFRRYGQTFGDDPGDPVEVAERHLARYGVLDAVDWRTRDDVRYLDPADRADLELWLAEQAWRLAHALSQRRDSPDDWRRGLKTLNRALTWAPYLPLERQAAILREQLHMPPTRLFHAPTSPSWQADYLDGLSHEVSDPSRSLSSYTRSHDARPSAFWPSYRAAVTAAQTGKRADAITFLTHCITRRPDNPALRVHRAGLLLTTDPEAALEDCNRALELDPDLAWGYPVRAILQRRQGRSGNGSSDIAEFRRLVRLPAVRSGPSLGQFLPLDTSALSNDIMGNDPGLEEYRQMGREHSELLFETANSWAEKGDYKSALSAFDCLVNELHGSLYARFNRMIILRCMGSMKGRENLRKLIAEPDFDDFVTENVAAIHGYQLSALDFLAEGEIDRAIEVSKRGLAKAEILKTSQGEANYFLSRIYAVAGRDRPVYRQQALEKVKVALRYDPFLFRQWISRDSVFDDLRPELNEVLTSIRSEPLTSPSSRAATQK